MTFAVLARRCLLFGSFAWLAVAAGSHAPARGDGPPAVAPGGIPLPLPPLPPPALELPKDPPPPVLKLKVRVPACAAAGRPLCYLLCVENCSPAEAHHVVVRDVLPVNARFVRADPMPTRVGTELQWHLGTIGGGARREIKLVLQPTDRCDVKNCARVQFEHGQCVVTRVAGFAPGMVPPMPPAIEPPGTGEPPGIGEPPGTGVPPSVRPPKIEPVPPITPREGFLPQLTLTAEGHKQQYVNVSARYFLTVTNVGKSRATNLLVTAVLPTGAKFERASGNGQFLERQVAWVFANLDPGARRTVEVVLSTKAPGEWCVKATARADLNVTATAEVCTRFLGTAKLIVDPRDRGDPLFVGSRTSFPIEVSNVGTAPITNIGIKVFIPAAVKLERTQPPEHKILEQTPTGQWIQFTVLPKLDSAAKVTYELFVEAVRSGDSRLRVEVMADQLEAGPLIEEENTTVVSDVPAPPPAPMPPGPE